MTKEAVYEAIEKVEKILSDNFISAYVDQFEDLPAITVHIRWGDWKHSHLRAKYLVSDVVGIPYVRSETTESDGSDCYSATHYFILPEYECLKALFE